MNRLHSLAGLAWSCAGLSIGIVVFFLGAVVAVVAPKPLKTFDRLEPVRWEQVR